MQTIPTTPEKLKNGVGIKMNDTIQQVIKDEFKDFQAPHRFSGGCKRSSMVRGYCVHFKADGTIGKIEQDCPNYDKCHGQNFKYNV